MVDVVVDVDVDGDVDVECDVLPLVRRVLGRCDGMGRGFLEYGFFFFWWGGEGDMDMEELGLGVRRWVGECLWGWKGICVGGRRSVLGWGCEKLGRGARGLWCCARI